MQKQQHLVMRIAQRTMLGFIIILIITCIFAYYHRSEISTEIANRLLPNYGVLHSNIQIGRLTTEECFLDEVTFQGSVNTNQRFTYTLLAQNSRLRYNANTLKRRHLASVEIEKLVIIITEENNSGFVKPEQMTEQDPLTVAALFIEQWRPLVPIDILSIKELEVKFGSESLSVNLIGLPLLKLHSSLELNPDALLANTILYTKNQDPLSIKLNAKTKEGIHLQLFQKNTSVFDLKLQPATQAKGEESYKITADADLTFINKIFKTLYRQELAPSLSQESDGRAAQYPIDLTLTGSFNTSGMILLPLLIKDISSDTITWTGNTHLDVNAELPSQGIFHIRFKGQLNSQWKNKTFTASLSQSLAYDFEPVWSYFGADNALLNSLKLSNESTVSGKISNGATFELTNDKSISFQSDKFLTTSGQDSTTGSRYTSSFSNITAHYLEEFKLAGLFEFSGSYGTLELPLNSTSIEFKQNETRMFVKLTSYFASLNANISTQLYYPFDSKQMSFSTNGTLKNLPHFQQFVSSITPAPKELRILTGTLLFSLSLRGNEKIIALSEIETLHKNITLTLDEVFLMFDDIPVTGLNAKWQLSGTQIMTSDTEATLTIDSIDIGFPITDTMIKFSSQFDFQRYYIDDQFNVNTSFSVFKSHLLGGEIYNAQTFTIDPIKPKGQLTLEVEKLQLAQILALNELEELKGVGSLSGTVPITIEEQGIQIINGKLNSIPPGGEIHYTLDDASKALVSQQAGLNIATDILENFHFDELTINFNFLPNGLMHLKNHFLGYNPDKFNGSPINLNLDLELNALKMMKSLRLSEEISDNIENRFSNE